MYHSFADLFNKYPEVQAPFMHQQRDEWGRDKPLKGLRVLHHVPVVQNTLLKIACLREAGADVVVTNPDFMQPCSQALHILRQEGVPFAMDVAELRHQSFDIYFDCGAVLYQALGAPKMGVVELTESGDTVYRSMVLDIPVVSIDRSLTKQLETVFGAAISAAMAIEKLTKKPVSQHAWLIFGFGKIGRGLAYYGSHTKTKCYVADIDPNALAMAKQLGLQTVDARIPEAIADVLQQVDIVVTATGTVGAMSAYPKAWFSGKILANMGILDEFGVRFAEHEVLNAKKPVNFILDDPTPIEYIDPEFYVHNQAALSLLDNTLSSAVHPISPALDASIIDRWCWHHHVAPEEIERWFF